MKIPNNPLNNESGFILVLGMAMLVVLTLIGLSATRTSVTDLKIAGNERIITQSFYIADSTWQVGALYLNNKVSYPDIVNMTLVGSDTDIDLTKEYYAIIRNYGNGLDKVTNEFLDPATKDGTFLSTDFWYRLIFIKKQTAVGYDKNFKDFLTEIQNRSGKTSGVDTRMFKVHKVGY